MPHLQIQHSRELSDRLDFGVICNTLRLAMIETGIFPAAGVRVRTFPASAYSIADGDVRNQFVHMMLRIGQGREPGERSQAGNHIFRTAQKLFADELASGHFALSFEIVEIDSNFSWKDNPIHARLSQTPIAGKDLPNDII